MSILGLLFITLWTFAMTIYGRQGRICPLPICKSCPTPQQLTQLGIGFAREMGYGTAAIRHHDEHIRTVAQIPGTSSYTALMRDLSQTTPQTRFPDEIPSLRGKLAYVRARLQRLANKAVGRPANTQAAIIAEMITKLKTAVEDTLPDGAGRAKVTHAIISSPDSIRLTDEELGDVLDYLKITNVMADPDELFAASAAYVGFGQGLCETYTKPYVCEREEEGLPYQRILHIGFTDEALTTTVKGVMSWKNTGSYASVIVPELGYKHRGDETDKPTDRVHSVLFDKIRDHIRDFTVSTGFKITSIMLTGTRVGEQRFKDAVSEALRDVIAENALLVQGEPFLVYGDIDFVFAGAKGAAEIAKRRLEGPVRCVWSRDCDGVTGSEITLDRDGSTELK